MGNKFPDQIHDATESHRSIVTFCVSGIAIAYTLFRGTWPEILIFATDSSLNPIERLTSAPIHLADDVMIQLRSGELLLNTGLPAFNKTDLAQASTSYIAPYLYAFLSWLLPSNAATTAYALLGLMAVAGSLAVVMFRAKAPINGVALVAALTLTTTNLTFSLVGWDHLIQGFLFVLATAITLSTPLEIRGLIAVSLLASAGVLARPDGIFIAIGLLAMAFLTSRGPFRKKWAAIFLPFAITLGATLVVNLLQFGLLTPTTVRLKGGAPQSLSYIFTYLWDNGVRNYSSLSVFLILTLIAALFHRQLDLRRVFPLLVAVGITVLLAAVSSDIFPGARMFWVPSLVLATVLAIRSPGLLTSRPAIAALRATGPAIHWAPRAQRVSAAAILSVLLISTFLWGFRASVSNGDQPSSSRTAQQFLATL